MKNKSIIKNYIYNLILTSINIVFPLITSPYLSYILGVENIGKVNYATSIINWFILIASFGIPRYGVREIARRRNSKRMCSDSFWNLIIIQTILTIISLLVYIPLIFTNLKFKQDINLYAIMIIMLIMNIFSIDWFYQGIEEYGYITKRNIIVKVISIILMFLMIKKKDDYLIYASLNVFAMCFNNILNYFNARKYIFKNIEKLDILYYFKELKVYFFTTLVIASYSQLDQVMIGNLSENDLAYYLRSKMVLSVGINITNSLVTVVIPRVAYLVEYNFDEYISILKKSINYIYMLAIPCTCGMFLLSRESILFLGGYQFLPAAYSLKIISINILIISIGNWQINQILIPNKKERVALNIQIIASIFSILLNMLIIPKLFYIGASITWVLTELLLVILETIAIRCFCNNIKISYFNCSFFKYIIASIIMSIVIIAIKISINSEIIILIISVILGGISYFSVLYLMKEKLVKNLFNIIILKLKNIK